MKNCLLVGLYPNEACPVFTIEFAKALKNNGYNIYAVLPDNIINKSNWIELLTERNISFIRLNRGKGKISKKINKYFSVLKFLLSYKKILKNILTVEYEFVFYTFFHRWNELVKRKVCTEKNILFVHDPVPHSDERKNRKSLQAKQIKKMDEIVVLSKRFIPICVDQYNLSRDKIYFMPHCLMNYGNHNNTTEYVENEKINFLFFGRITKYKGIEVLLKAFAEIEKSFEGAFLNIVGGGDFKQYEKDFSKLKNVMLINKYIEDNEISSYFLKHNTVCVLPYLDATQSGVIAIAYEYGTAVIASDTGGLKEQLCDGEVGIFCEPNNVESLIKAMQLTIQNFAELKKQSTKMIQYSKLLNWDNSVRLLLDELK